ncbi:hypothetical protein TNCV_1840051 [Trichonephila clavipes]|nr:hypothetical protein TNCV_1840051 [Trichonephila clavipes]
MDTNTAEYIFAFDFLHFVMERSGVFWRPRKQECRVNSIAFTTDIKDFITYYLHKEERNIYFLFVTLNKKSTIDNETFPMIAENLKCNIFSYITTIADLMRYCIVICQFSLLAYFRGSYLAPYTGLIVTYDAVKAYICNKAESPSMFWETLGVKVSELVHEMPPVFTPSPSAVFQRNDKHHELRQQELKKNWNKKQNPQETEFQKKQQAEKSPLREYKLAQHHQQNRVPRQDEKTFQKQQNETLWIQQQQRFQQKQLLWSERRKVRFQQQVQQLSQVQEHQKLFEIHRQVLQELKEWHQSPQFRGHRRQKRLPDNQEQVKRKHIDLHQAKKQVQSKLQQKSACCSFTHFQTLQHQIDRHQEQLQTHQELLLKQQNHLRRLQILLSTRRVLTPANEIHHGKGLDLRLTVTVALSTMQAILRFGSVPSPTLRENTLVMARSLTHLGRSSLVVKWSLSRARGQRVTCSRLSATKDQGCGSPVVKISDHGRHVMSSSPVPLKARRVEKRCTLNLSRAQMLSSSLDHGSKLRGLLPKALV